MLLISFFGGWLIPRIAQTYGIGNAFALGAISCLFSLFMALSLIFMDLKAKKYDKKMWSKRKDAIQKLGLFHKIPDNDHSSEDEAKNEEFKW